MVDQFHENKFPISTFCVSDVLKRSAELFDGNILAVHRVIRSTEIKMNKCYIHQWILDFPHVANKDWFLSVQICSSSLLLIFSLDYIFLLFFQMCFLTRMFSCSQYFCDKWHFSKWFHCCKMNYRAVRYVIIMESIVTAYMGKMTTLFFKLVQVTNYFHYFFTKEWLYVMKTIFFSSVSLKYLFTQCDSLL